MKDLQPRPLPILEDTAHYSPDKGSVELQAFTSPEFQQRVLVGLSQLVSEYQKTSFSVLRKGNELVYTLTNPNALASANPLTTAFWNDMHARELAEYEVVGTFQFANREKPFTSEDIESYERMTNNSRNFPCPKDRFEGVFLPRFDKDAVTLFMFAGPGDFNMYTDFDDLTTVFEQKRELEEGGMRVIVVDLPVANGTIDFGPLEEALQEPQGQARKDTYIASEPTDERTIEDEKRTRDMGRELREVYDPARRPPTTVTDALPREEKPATLQRERFSGRAVDVEHLVELIASDQQKAFATVEERVKALGSAASLGAIPVAITFQDRYIIFGLDVRSEQLPAFVRYAGNDIAESLQLVNRLSPGIFQLDMAIDLLPTNQLVFCVRSEKGIYDQATHRDLDLSKISPLNPTLFAAFVHTLSATRSADLNTGTSSYSAKYRGYSGSGERGYGTWQGGHNPDFDYFRDVDVQRRRERQQRISEGLNPVPTTIFPSSSGINEQVDQSRLKPWKKGSPGNPPGNRKKEPSQELKPAVSQPKEAVHYDRPPVSPPVIQPSSSREWDDLPHDVYSRDPVTGEHGWREIPPKAPLNRNTSPRGEAKSSERKEKKPKKPKKIKGPGRYSNYK